MSQAKTNPTNDRVKRDYLIWLKEAKQRCTATVEQARHAIDRFERYTGFKDFSTFNKDQAMGFKRALLDSKVRRSGKPTSISTVHHMLKAIKEFLAWLHGREDYRRRIVTANIAYLNLTTGEERQAHATGPKQYATVEEYRKALFAMPTGTEIERRDQAIMALMLLTCMRDAAVVSLKLRHIDLKRKRVFQDPRQVKTKFSKTIETVFYPVGNDVEVVFARWVKYLITERQFRSDDPLFPKTVSGHDEHRNFISAGLGREHWTNATSVRKIFRTAFERVGLPYVRPHSIRDTLTQLAYQLELTGEELKAWSQNMGHDSLVTTLNSYGHLTIERQAEIIGSLGHRQPSVSTDDDMATKIAEKIIFMLENPRT